MKIRWGCGSVLKSSGDPSIQVTFFSGVYLACYWLCLLKLFTSHRNMGFPGGASGKESACQCRRCKRGGFSPWVGKIVGGKGTATHSSVLALEIPWTEEPGRLQCIGLQSQTQRKRLSTRSHRNGLILATLPDCKWPPESAGSGVPDERAYLHRLRSRHHPDHWQSEGAERPQRHLNTLGLESGWHFHSPVLILSPDSCGCLLFFLSCHVPVLRWTTADILPDGVWWRHVSVSSAPRLGWRLITERP